MIAGDDKFVSMKYFFTRKLMLIKESKGFISLPGGFGTIDETFELLTLTQTGKGLPVPIVLLDTPGDPYWETLDEFIRGQLVRRGLVSARDPGLYFITDDTAAAVREIVSFYRNYESIRYVGDIARPAPAPRADARRSSSSSTSEFGYLCATGAHRGQRPARARGTRARCGRPAPHRVPLRQARLRRPARPDQRGQRLRRSTGVERGGTAMKVEQIWVYPVKSMIGGTVADGRGRRAGHRRRSHLGDA